MKGFSFVGSEKKANAYWPTVSKTRSYGGSSDLWGSAWTPGDINSEDFGIWLKCYNQGASSPEASVDYMRVTIYYAGEFGVEKQTVDYDFTSSPLSIYPNPATQNTTLTFFCPGSGMLTQSIFNMEGKEILSQSEKMEKGQVINQLDVSALPAGNYFIRYEMKGRTWTGNLVKE
jgi:hypothetical protein